MSRAKDIVMTAAIMLGVGVLTGCGNDDASAPIPDPTTTSAPAGASTPTAAPETQTPSSQGSATLTFADGTNVDIPEMTSCTYSAENGFALEGEGPYEGKQLYFQLLDNPADPDFEQYKRSYKMAYESDFDGWRSAPGYVVRGGDAQPAVSADGPTVTVSVELTELKSQGLIPAMNGGGKLTVAATCAG